MRKIFILMIIAAILLLIGITGSFVTFPGMNSNTQVLSEKTITEHVDELIINTDNAKISFLQSDSSDIEVKLLHASDDSESFVTEVKNNRLQVNIERQFFNFFNINFFMDLPKLEIYLPDAQYDLVDINSKNGAINLNQLDSSIIKINTANGKISLTDIAADEINVKTYNGRIDFTNITGELTAKTSNGAITLTTDDLEQPLDLQTSNGKITIHTVHQPQNVTFDVFTDFGRVTVFEQKDWNAVWGNGENIIKLRTNNGSITVNHSE